MSKFNFIGVNPENLYVGSTVNVTLFYRDSNESTEWSANHSSIRGFYKVIEITKKTSDKYKLKLQATKRSFGIHGGKGYFATMNITVNSKGQSDVHYSSSSSKVSGRYVIYNAIIG